MSGLNLQGEPNMVSPISSLDPYQRTGENSNDDGDNKTVSEHRPLAF